MSCWAGRWTEKNKKAMGKPHRFLFFVYYQITPRIKINKKFEE